MRKESEKNDYMCMYITESLCKSTILQKNFNKSNQKISAYTLKIKQKIYIINLSIENKIRKEHQTINSHISLGAD